MTLTAVRLAAADRLAAATGTLAAALQSDTAAQFAAIWAAHKTAKPFKFRQCDLATFCADLAGNAQTPQPTMAPVGSRPTSYRPLLTCRSHLTT